jgi:hypothetical protein
MPERAHLVMEFVGTVGSPNVEVLSHVAQAIGERLVPRNPDHLAQRRCLSLEIVLGDHDLPTRFTTPNRKQDA